MKLSFINESISESQKSSIERGESSYLFIYIYIYIYLYKAFVFIQRIDKVEEKN